jgi:MoxR-like ATPase
MTYRIEQVLQQAAAVILGKPQALRLALACILARGHLLIEDLPGVGKTTLAHTLARVLGLEFNRIQFTSDLLPADILGTSIYESSGQFRFHPGPIFSQVVLADEINRAMPKTQSALLEAMEESQITIEGETRPLPQPFFVLATQNPLDQVGTYPLPESQLDRFLMRIEIGYPDPTAERALLQQQDRREVLQSLEAACDVETLLQWQALSTRIHLSEALFDYIQSILLFTRQHPSLITGLSPRAGLALMHAAQAWAMLQQRDHVIPEDVKAILPAVTMHRLFLQHNSHDTADKIVTELLHLPIP